MRKVKKSITEKEIKILIKERNILVFNDEVKANEIENQIFQLLKDNFNFYSCDFILESLTEFGWCPSLVNDDNGLWAVSCGGCKQVVTGKEKIEGIISIFIDKKQWKKNIRLAVKHCLFSN